MNTISETSSYLESQKNEFKNDSIKLLTEENRALFEETVFLHNQLRKAADRIKELSELSELKNTN